MKDKYLERIPEKTIPKQTIPKQTIPDCQNSEFQIFLPCSNIER